MSKKRKSVSLDESVANEIDRRSHLNFSALVNDLVQEYLAGGKTGSLRESVLEVRLERIERQIEEKQEQIEHLREERDYLEDMLAQEDTQSDSLIEEIPDGVLHISDDKLNAENEAIITQAQKMNRTPAELVEAIEEHRNSQSMGSDL